MRQLKLTFLLTVLMSMVGVRAMAHDFEAKNANGAIIYYLTTSDTEVAVSYRGTSRDSYYYNYVGNIVIPESVTYNGITYNVTSIGKDAFCGCSSMISVTIPNSVTSIGENAFSNCFNLTSITIPNSVTSIGSDAFNGTTWLNNQPNGLVYAGKVLYQYKGSIPGNTAIIIEDGTLGIAAGAFSNNCSGITSVSIPNSVTTIGNGAFSNCSGLTSITIPNSVTSIGNGAFMYCNNLTTITIPNSIMNIGYNAFNNTAWYNNQPNGLVYVAKHAYKYKGTMPENTAIVLENGTKSIVGFAFELCSGLTSISIPNSVTSIGEYAFKTCRNLTSVEIPNSVTSIREGAFSNCSGLTSIDIPNGVTSIGEKAFTSCSGLTSVTISNNVTTIGNSVFSLCKGLTSVTIPNSVKSIGTSAFNTCSNLTSINIPNSVTSIGNSAFESCSNLASITIPNSVKSIGNSAFYGCSNLTSINIPNSVTNIGNGAFSETAWLNNQPDGLVYAGKLVYKYKGTMPWNTSIVIKEGTLGIVDNAFAGRSSLISVTIPSSVTNIGSYAFYGCTNLPYVTIPNSVTSIGDYAFQNCSSLKSITIPSSVTKIGSYTFSGCSGLTMVTIPNSVSSIDNYAFAECSSLTSVFVEWNNPISITYYVFLRNYNATLYVPAGSKEIYETADNWKSFKEIVELTDVSVLDDAIYVEAATAFKSGGTLNVYLKNTQTTNAYSFDLRLPWGVTVDSYTLSDRHNGHSVSLNKNSFAVLSLQSTEVTGNSGAVLTLRLKVNDQVVVGDYAIKVVNAKYSLTSGTTSVALPETVSRLTIENYMRGDANGDGEVDIADAVCIVNHVVGKQMPLFVASAADVNLDAEIDIADAVRIVNLVVGKINALARRFEWNLAEPE